MSKFLSNGAMIFAGLVSVPAIITTVDARLAPKPSLPADTFKPDPRLPLLEGFFESIDAPAKAFSHVFLAEADQNALDWRLLPSISFRRDHRWKSGSQQ